MGWKTGRLSQSFPFEGVFFGLFSGADLAVGFREGMIYPEMEWNWVSIDMGNHTLPDFSIDMDSHSDGVSWEITELIFASSHVILGRTGSELATFTSFNLGLEHRWQRYSTRLKAAARNVFNSWRGREVMILMGNSREDEDFCLRIFGNAFFLSIFLTGYFLLEPFRQHIRWKRWWNPSTKKSANPFAAKTLCRFRTQS